MKMARLQLHLIILLLIFIISGCKLTVWESLFNGKDLDGWSVKCLPADQGKKYWTVTNGYIQCNSMGDTDHNYVWLMSDRVFTDFHLRLRFQVFRESGGNSGVQFRSSYDDSDSATYGGWLNGPQADIHGPDPYRTGLIYDETEGVRRWIYPSLPDWNITPEQAPRSALETRLVYFEDSPDAWNDMEIICNGMRVVIRVNGNRVTVFNGDGILNDTIHQLRKSGESGHIAFQLHMNDELKIRFKDIFIRE